MFGTWEDAQERYEDMLDSEGPVNVAGLEFLPSRILREMDPTAYKCGLFDYVDAEGIDSDDLTGDYTI